MTGALLRLRLLFRSLFLRRRVEEDLAAEFEFHLASRVSQLEASGLSPREAQRLARKEFGSTLLHAERCRDTRKLGWLESLVTDVRYSVRALWKEKLFSALSIGSLALGIGLATSIFAIVDVSVLHPLPLPETGRLVWFREFSKGHEESGGNPARLRDWAQLRSFTAVTGVYSDRAVVTGLGDPMRWEGLFYTGDLFAVLGSPLQLGRFPSMSEVSKSESLVVISDAIWRRYYGGRRDALARSIRLGEENCQIVGVLSPSAAAFAPDHDFWKPMPRSFQEGSRAAGYLSQIGHLASGTTLAQAQAEVNTLLPRLAEREPATDGGRDLRLQSLTEHLVGEVKNLLAIFLAGAVGVLMIACLNVAGLLLARGLARHRESSIRVALGAGRARLIRLFLCEASLLALGGFCTGLLLADFMLAVLKLLLPSDTPRLSQASLSPSIFGFAILMASLAMLLSGWLPAWKAAQTALLPGLKEGAAGSLGTQSRLRGVLVTSQIAATLCLLISAALLLNSFSKLSQQPLGFTTSNVYSFSLNFPWDTPDQTLLRAVNLTLDGLRAAPGISAVGIVDQLPLHGGSQSRQVLVEGRTLSSELDARQVGWRLASKGYFNAAGIQLLRGRIFGAPERHECVISKELATALFGSTNPIGHSIAARPDRASIPKWLQITGIVASTRYAPTDSRGAAEVYLSWGADYWPMLNVVMKSHLAPAATRSTIRQVVASRLPGQPIEHLDSLSNLTTETHSPFRNRAYLALALAMIALLLSSIGLFALLAHESVCRMPEYGMRAVLGASQRSLAIDALGRGLRVTLPGIGLGLVAAVFLARNLQAFLFGVQPLEPRIYVWVTGISLFMALVASILPAIRATRVDPLTTLRHD
jgi:putative ABC transport system permease protein